MHNASSTPRTLQPLTKRRKYAYAWVTLAFFLFSLAGHWIFGWFAYRQAQQEHQAPVLVAEYLVEMGRDTLENWQSEFLQLLWQVGGLAFLLYVGSPQSREGDERHEEKLDAILRHVAKDDGARILADIDRRWAR